MKSRSTAAYAWFEQKQLDTKKFSAFRAHHATIAIIRAGRKPRPAL
jgi:hypothetical protein